MWDAERAEKLRSRATDLLILKFQISNPKVSDQKPRVVDFILTRTSAEPTASASAALVAMAEALAARAMAMLGAPGTWRDMP